MKRVIAILLAAFMLVGYVPVSAQEKMVTGTLTLEGLPLDSETLNIEVLDGDQVVETVVSNSSLLMFTKVEEKTYVLREKSGKYDIENKYMKVVNKDGFYVAFFLKSDNEEVLEDDNPEALLLMMIRLKLKDQNTGTGSEPQDPIGSEVLKELPIKVEYKGQPKANFALAAHKKEGIFYNMVLQVTTNENGVVILKNLAPNSEYVVRAREVRVYFEEESFVILTNEKGEVKSINGKSVTKYPEGIIFKMVDKEDSSIKKVRVEFKTVDKKTGEPAVGVVLTANTINPNLGSYKDEISDDNGVVKFDLIGAENGKNYSITVSKNGQFLWDFEPAEIEVVVKNDGYEILSTKGNENKGNVLKVTANDRRHLKVDLAKLIQKAEEIIASDEYKKDYKKELSRAVLGGKMELEKAETLPYYVEGHISNIESLMKKIVLKDKPLSETESSNSSNNVDTYTEYTGIVEKGGEVKVEKKEEIKADKAENKVEEPEVEIVINPPSIPFGMIDIAVTPAQDAIRNTVERGILKGISENKFEPKLPVSRAMVTEVLMRLAADKSVNDSIVFSDVNKDSWYAKSVKWAASHNIIKGYKDGTFRADKKVSLQEFAYMLKDYGKKMPKTLVVDRSSFDYLPEWSREAVIALVEVGLIEVSQTGKNAFDGEITREYLAVVIDKLIRFTEESIAK